MRHLLIFNFRKMSEEINTPDTITPAGEVPLYLRRERIGEMLTFLELDYELSERNGDVQAYVRQVNYDFTGDSITSTKIAEGEIVFNASDTLPDLDKPDKLLQQVKSKLAEVGISLN